MWGAGLYPHLLILTLTLSAIGTARCEETAAQRISDGAIPLIDNDGRVNNDGRVRYDLQINREVTVSTSLVRLRDVAEPVGPAAPAWDRLGGIVIAMLPVGNQEMVLEKARLSELLRSDPAVPELLLSGPETIRVSVRAAAPADVSRAVVMTPHRIGGEQPPKNVTDIPRMNSTPPAPSTTDISVAGYSLETSQAAGGPKSKMVAPATNESESATAVDDFPPLAAKEAERLAKLVHFGIDRANVSLREAFDIEIDPMQPGLRPLDDVRRIDSVKFTETPREGEMHLKVSATASRHEVAATVAVVLTARPLVVVARDGLRRGHVISSDDVMLMPVPRGVEINSVFRNIEDVVGMQVQSVLQRERPISLSSIARPIVIERGDLVEVRVVGGGVTVTAAGRSLGRGAAGELVSVETLDPRKKVMARVVKPGLVEINTRPPRVQ